MDTFTFDEYLALGDSSVWIVQDLLPVGGKINIMGEPKVGKSFFGLQLAEALSYARQPKWLNHFPVLRKGPVFFMQIDTSRSVWQDRLRRLRLTMDLSHIRWADKLALPRSFDIRIPSCIRSVQHTLGQLPEWPMVVIVDVIRSVHRGSEDESGNMQDVIDSLQEAVDPAALVILSHTRKPSADRKQRTDAAESMNENRGSSALNGSVDTLMKLTTDHLYVEARSAERFQLPLQQTRNGLWQIAPVQNLKVSQIMEFLQDATLATLSAKAQAMQQRYHVPVDRAKILLRKVQRSPKAAAG